MYKRIKKRGEGSFDLDTMTYKLHVSKSDSFLNLHFSNL